MTGVEFVWLKWWWFKKGESRPSGKIEAMLKNLGAADRAQLEAAIEQLGADGTLRGLELVELPVDRSQWSGPQRSHEVLALTLEEWIYAMGRSRIIEDRNFATAFRKLKRPAAPVRTASR